MKPQMAFQSTSLIDKLSDENTKPPTTTNRRCNLTKSNTAVGDEGERRRRI